MNTQLDQPGYVLAGQGVALSTQDIQVHWQNYMHCMSAVPALKKPESPRSATEWDGTTRVQVALESI